MKDDARRGEKRGRRDQGALHQTFSAFDPSAVIMTSELQNSVAETLAQKIVALKAGALPAATNAQCEDLLIDVVGLASPRVTRTTSPARSRLGR